MKPPSLFRLLKILGRQGFLRIDKSSFNFVNCQRLYIFPSCIVQKLSKFFSVTPSTSPVDVKRAHEDDVISNFCLLSHGSNLGSSKSRETSAHPKAVIFCRHPPAARLLLDLNEKTINGVLFQILKNELNGRSAADLKLAVLLSVSALPRTRPGQPGLDARPLKTRSSRLPARSLGHCCDDKRA